MLILLYLRLYCTLPLFRVVRRNSSSRRTRTNVLIKVGSISCSDMLSPWSIFGKMFAKMLKFYMGQIAHSRILYSLYTLSFSQQKQKNPISCSRAPGPQNTPNSLRLILVILLLKPLDKLLETRYNDVIKDERRDTQQNSSRRSTKGQSRDDRNGTFPIKET